MHPNHYTYAEKVCKHENIDLSEYYLSKSSPRPGAMLDPHLNGWRLRAAWGHPTGGMASRYRCLDPLKAVAAAYILVSRQGRVGFPDLQGILAGAQQETKAV